jgi:predicted dehydrogenase
VRDDFNILDFFILIFGFFYLVQAMTEKKLRFALIGAGNIAAKYADAFGKIEKASLVGVVTRNPQKARAFAEKHNLSHWATDIKTFFDSTDVDAVVIATPSGLHAEGAIEAAKFGKHVLCEKPLDITLEKIDAMTAACKKANVKLACSFQFRTFEHNKITCDAIRSGKLGEIYIANAFLKNYRGQEYYDSGAWRGTWALDGGGPFMQQGAHTVDLMVWMMGRAKRVCARIKTVAHNIEVEDMGHAIVEYENGAQGLIEASTVVVPGYPNRLEFHGEKGSIILSESEIVDWQVEGVEKPAFEGTTQASGSKDPMAIGTIGHQKLIADFVDAIQQDRPPLVTPESARLSVELIQAVYASAKSGKNIEIR